MADLRLLFLFAGEGCAGLLDGCAGLVLAVLGEKGRDAHQPRLGPIRVEPLGLRECLESSLQVAEVQLRLG